MKNKMFDFIRLNIPIGDLESYKILLLNNKEILVLNIK